MVYSILWIFSNACINQIERLIRNYLWSGKHDDRTRAKITWDIITLPKSIGRLGIIDLVKQRKTHLAKLVVQSLLPEDEIWKKMLINRMSRNSPMVGKPWKQELHWILNEDLRLKKSYRWEDRFINGIWSAWKDIRRGLFRKDPSTNEE